MQDGYSITFANKTLTDVETHYANIERECLSVCFGCEKFHTYINGRHTIIQNDHKPLEMHKPIHAAPSPSTIHATIIYKSMITPYSKSLART